MKTKSLFRSLHLAIILVLSLNSCDRQTIITSSDLPSEISNYITTHFPENSIVQAVIDRDGLKKTYDIWLSDNFNLEFNRKKQIIEIDGFSQLPNSVIPEKILQFIELNYPNNFIISWELDDKHQQIQLDNGLDLEFNMKGDFLRIDN